MDLILPYQLKQEIPLSNKGKQWVAHSRKTASEIIKRQDERLLTIVGPCSIHSVEEATDYALQLRELAKEVSPNAFVVMRTYIEKSRTALGWKGLVHDPHLNGSEDLAHGLRTVRAFLTMLAEKEIPTACEWVTPNLTPYFDDLITYGSIGARTATSQVHRLIASSLPMPIGVKNSVDGNVHSAVKGVHVARSPHTFPHVGNSGTLELVKSRGNPHAHVVLRGAQNGTNFDKESVEETLSEMRRLEIPPRVVIDCSHGNAQGRYFQQREVFYDVLEQIESGNRQIVGVMLESHLEAGSQIVPSQLSEMQRGVSITDPCIDYSMTAELLSAIGSPSSMSCTKS